MRTDTRAAVASTALVRSLTVMPFMDYLLGFTGRSLAGR
jgi:hypothetical protein